MVVFFLTEVLDAVIARLKQPALSFAPKIVQRGDLSWYAEAQAEVLPNELPAVYVWAPDGDTVGVEGTEDPEGFTVASGLIGTWRRVRVAVCDRWTTPLDLHAHRIDYVEEIAERFVGTGYPNLGGAILGAPPAYTVLKAVPTRIEPTAPEDELVSQQWTRNIWAGAVDLFVTGRARRS